MSATLDLLRQTVCDREGLPDEAYAAIEELIAQHPFAERILYLLINQQLAKQPVCGRYIKSSKPNCIGTAFFVAGVSRLPYPYHGNECELDEHMRVPAKPPVPGAFVYSYDAEEDDRHLGIYLGEALGTSYAFAQIGYACPFAIEQVSLYYPRSRYYLPATLVQD